MLMAIQLIKIDEVSLFIGEGSVATHLDAMYSTGPVASGFSARQVLVHQLQTRGGLSCSRYSQTAAVRYIERHQRVNSSEHHHI